MKILVSTKETQGERKNDFSWTNDEEILTFGFECDGGSVDDDCGCSRAFSGIDTNKATTTAKVIESEMVENDYFNKLYESYLKAWKFEDSPGLVIETKNVVSELLRIANGFDMNTIVEKRGDVVQSRKNK